MEITEILYDIIERKNDKNDAVVLVGKIYDYNREIDESVRIRMRIRLGTNESVKHSMGNSGF